MLAVACAEMQTLHPLMMIAWEVVCFPSQALSFVLGESLPGHLGLNLSVHHLFLIADNQGEMQQQESSGPSSAESSEGSQAASSVPQQQLDRQQTTPAQGQGRNSVDMRQRISDIASKFRMNTELRPDEGLSNSIGLVPDMRRKQEFQHQMRLAERRLALQQQAAANAAGSSVSLEQSLKASLDKFR